MNNRDLNALRTDIGRMSTHALEAAEAEILGQIQITEAQWAQIDIIRDELAGRQHDLEDPSSGLGLHQHSGSRE